MERGLAFLEVWLLYYLSLWEYPVEQVIPVLKKKGVVLIFFFSWHFQETDTIGVDVVIYYISIYWHNKLQQFLYQRILESPDGTGSIFLV